MVKPTSASAAAGVAGALLLGLICRILNVENGRGTISLGSYRQMVIRGAILLVVVPPAEPGRRAAQAAALTATNAE